LISKERWFIGIRRLSPGTDPLPQRLDDFRYLIPPRDRFYADPFVIQRNGKNYLFFEDYRYDQRKAVISCIEIDSKGDLSAPEVVLARNYHLSYPFLFEWNDQVFMIPETSQNRTIELYRAISFPHHWQLEAVLMEDVRAVDATVLRRQGKFWLFVNTAAPGCPIDDELFLFHADTPLGPWTPHRCNPIVSDVRTARPAGGCLIHDGTLVRPSQDCSVSYGHAISFNRVETLSEGEYKETLIHRIDPTSMPGTLGTHTYNRNDDYAVLDSRRNVCRWSQQEAGWSSLTQKVTVREDR
jgi:hypothetical protein